LAWVTHKSRAQESNQPDEQSTSTAISSESAPSAADPESIRVWQRGGGVFVIFIGMEK
jgi:hypothetical protein